MIIFTFKRPWTTRTLCSEHQCTL